MNNKVLYFSRSGNAKRIAEKTAKKLGCETLEITDNVSWKGFFGFMKGGFYSINQKITEVSIENDYNVSEADTIVLVVPLWAGNTAPAGYSFLLKEMKNIKKLYMVICNDGSDFVKAYAKLETMVGNIKNKYGITKNKGNEDSVIDNICLDITGI